MVKLRSITRFPIYYQGMLSFEKSKELPFPLEEEKVYFYGYGRYALYQGMLSLGLEKGDHILFPNYICNVALAPAHYLGLHVDYYEIDELLKPKWNKIDKRIADKSKAFLIVNYFGFPNDLVKAREFCDKHEQFLIEDNAHGFLSHLDRTPLGTFGDISVFSFHKTVPIFNGSALVINKHSISMVGDGENNLISEKRTVRFIVKTLILSIRNCLSFLNVNKVADKKIDLNPNIEKEQEFDLQSYFISISNYSKWFLNHLNINSVASRRRKRYFKWLQYFQEQKEYKVRIIFPELKPGIVPYVFPVITNQSEILLDKMRQCGVECYPWPFLPKDSREDYLSGKVVCFPLS
ncbi:MAG: hypothetical protein A2447_11920 [Omnitrophica WOR_2 bacterium RIFOXYC2_FULL_38_12]|nr:MAG: hypothetical protein A2447_11920 [Omnitrophica WOR_2 bacterium RIFOXYC2_FULL_38_12]